MRDEFIRLACDNRASTQPFVQIVRVSAVFDSDAVGKIEGIIDVEDDQG